LICAYEKFLDQSFLDQALVTINKIYTYDIYEDSAYGKLLAPGDTWHDYFNPSYFLPAAIKTFAIYDTNSAHDWETIYNNNLTLLQNNQTKFNCYGLPSNWCTNDGTPISGNSDLTFGYDACRVIDNIANGYNIYHDKNLYSYLSAISNNSALLTRINSTDPISACSLKISPTTWGSEDNSLGLVCILPAYQITGELSESKLESLLDDCLAVSAIECLDYYKQAYKSVVLSVMTSDCSRYATDLASSANPGYLMKVYPPDEFSGSNPIMIKIPDNNEIYDLKSLFSYTTNTISGMYLSANVLDTLSGNWNESYDIILANSATWNLNSGNNTINGNYLSANTFDNLSGNWNNKLDKSSADTLYESIGSYLSANTFDNLSGNWNKSYDIISANSATWNSNGGSTSEGFYLSATALNPLSGNWNNSYNIVSANSANWNKISAISAEVTTISESLPTLINVSAISAVSSPIAGAYYFVVE
jgi:hypothetical protein